MPTSPSNRLFAAALVVIVALIVWHNLTRLAPDGDALPDTSYSVLERHRDRLVEHLVDIARAIENAT